MSGQILDFQEPPLTHREQNKTFAIHEGMIPSPALDADGKVKWGFRNSRGEWLIAAQYFSVEPFYFGKALAQTIESYKLMFDAQYILIDIKRKNLFPEDTFHLTPAPNHLGLGYMTFMPRLGERFGKSYLYHWKKNLVSEFSISPRTDRILWEDKWVSASRFEDYNGKEIGIGAYYDETFSRVLDRVEGKYILLESESFSEDSGYATFYDPDSAKKQSVSGYIDRNGKILFAFDRKKLSYPPPYMKSGYVLVSKVE